MQSGCSVLRAVYGLGGFKGGVRTVERCGGEQFWITVSGFGQSANNLGEQPDNAVRRAVDCSGEQEINLESNIVIRAAVNCLRKQSYNAERQ